MCSWGEPRLLVSGILRKPDGKLPANKTSSGDSRPLQRRALEVWGTIFTRYNYILQGLSWTRMLPRLTQIRGPAQTNMICALLYYRFLQGYMTTNSIAIGWFLLSFPKPGWLLRTGRFDLSCNFMCVPSWLPRLSFNRPRYKKEVCYLTTPGCFLLTCMLILTWRLHSRIYRIPSKTKTPIIDQHCCM